MSQMGKENEDDVIGMGLDGELLEVNDDGAVQCCKYCMYTDCMSVRTINTMYTALPIGSILGNRIVVIKWHFLGKLSSMWSDW